MYRKKLMYECPICAEHPGSHSFALVNIKDDGTYVFYTCPAKAVRFRDEAGIVAHYEGFLTEIGDAPWEWVVDFAGYQLVHATAPNVAIRISKLIMQKYKKHLQKITIINQNLCVDMIINIVRPFISSDVQKLICFHGKLDTGMNV